ncbi:hypothetical protein PIB30_087254 [Stylosanthes scabra]|uniref:TIR domain-containing protein n=1 Tax=Stylosanthes scabra TaxID=79078 RepID=A0ABU6ZRY8_9FABA|nr:hypothetical protein [Stylosanthes scabra]
MALHSPFSSSSSINYAWKYDVFISFRGQDTRYGFTGNLYKALCDKGIHAFIDDEELQTGDEITPSLLQAIQQSRIAVIVLSPNYASSTFCLDELVNILDFIKGNNRLVLPVFYDVDPSDVRHQRNSFGEAMIEHEKRFKNDMNKVQKWKEALQQVSNLSGYHFKYGDGYEYMFIGNMVENISKKIRRQVPLPVADHLVGLESPVSKISSLLDVESNAGVHMVGIHGIGGIGKTTLALTVYNLIADNFESSCFLENVRENSNRYGLVHLQTILLYETLGEKDIKLTSTKQGTSEIQKRLCRKKVLLVLDDVDEKEQLKAIAGKPNWFGPGSRVIITTRDKHLLILYGVERTYEVQGLSKNESFSLLTWKAFKADTVSPRYASALTCAVRYASGLPLALEVIGSNLFGKDLEQWESALDQYEKILDNKIRKILQVSFDALGKEVQSVFLDIACCFKGYTLMEVTNILQAHYGSCMRYHVGVLVEKSLIKIEENGKVMIHDLIEDMGKAIVLEESPEIPGKRSRLWFYEDILKVLENNQKLVSLKVLNFDDSDSLKEIPDVSNLQTLQEFSFRRCRNLVTVHSSVGFLPNLKILNAEDCLKLKNFPPAIHLPSLEDLGLSGCSSLENFPEIPEEMENVGLLDLEGTGIRDLPCSFRNLSGLWYLKMSRNKKMCKIPSVIGMMPQLSSCHIWGSGNKGRVSAKQEEGLQGILTHSLPSSNVQHLYLTNWKLSDDFFPLALAWFPNVKCLDLRGNDFTVLPECIQQFRFLWWLNVDDCEHLREIKGIPPSLKDFAAINCKSLSPRGASMLVNQKLHENGGMAFALPGRRIPRWFEQHKRGESISFWFRGNYFPFKGLCLAILLKDDLPFPVWIRPIVTINGNQVSRGREIKMDQLFIFDLSITNCYGYDDETLSFEDEWNHAEVSYEARDNVYRVVPTESIAKEIGMHILKQESCIMQDIRFTDPYEKIKLIIMMLSIVYHKHNSLLMKTCIDFWTLLFLTHTLLGTNTL